MAGKKFRIPQNTKNPVLRKHLNANSLIELVKDECGKVKDNRGTNQSITAQDALMSAFAMFSLKDPSLLAFDGRRNTDDEANLQRMYGIDRVPSDTQMRKILDPLDPSELRGAYKRIFSQIQRGKALEQLTYMDGHYLLSGDGTGFFYSEKLTNGHCLVQTRSKSEKKGYHQMFYGLVLMHPDFREVIAFPPEFIVKQDGATKNDCEREASKRSLNHFRREHPHLKVIMTEDGLASNGPHIQELQKHDMRFILGAKEKDHAYLFEQAFEEEEAGRATNFVMNDPDNPRIKHNFFFVNGLSLNKAHAELKVNFLEYWEIHLDKNGEENKGKQKHFSWVTDLEITTQTAYDIMRGGRARWRIENETFNTLKNQGYHLEHNFGLGKENLSMVFVTMMMLAFLVDQTLQLCCGLYRAAWTTCDKKVRFFERIRCIYSEWELDSFNTILKLIVFRQEKRQVPDWMG